MIKEFKPEMDAFNKDAWEVLFKAGNELEFKPGDFIFKQNELAEVLIFFKKGKIKLYTIIPGGMERTICEIETPCLLCEGPVIDGGNNICMAKVLTKTNVIFIPREIVLAELLKNPDVLHLMMSTLANKLRFMQNQVEDASFRIPQRLARLLICGNEYRLLQDGEKELILSVTHIELASCLGTTRPKVTEHLNNFEKHGLIEKVKGYIIIKDYEGLKNIAGKFSYSY